MLQIPSASAETTPLMTKPLNTLLLVALISPIAFAQTAVSSAPSAVTSAVTSPQMPEIQQALALKLDESPEWHNLLHYRPSHLALGWLSQADDAHFFFSPDGKTQPQQELIANISALLDDGLPDAGNGDVDRDLHPRCRFPARDHWLRQQLGLANTPLDCPALNQWMRKLNTARVTLVLAASYLNSPSSMFGHTFLRLDPPQQDQTTNLLLASTISYAADAAAHDGELLFAWRGIFGGYPGITTVQPYHEKIKQYSDIENRDLWEYQLNLTPQEIQRLLWHTWEIKDKNFDYYFFDENCAYRLLALIDVARPGTQLLDQVDTHAIPSDTVRWVVHENLVDTAAYRPSAATVVHGALQQLNTAEKAEAAALLAGATRPDNLGHQVTDADSRIRVLDATYDYVQFAAADQRWPRDKTAPLSWSLLQGRSLEKASGGLTPPQTPAIREDQGHETLRLGIGAGEDDRRDFTQLSLRPAYHDLLDPPDGYRDGAQLEFLAMDARYYHDNQSLSLDRLTLIDIRSLAARDAFFKPLSWQVGTGLRRTLTEPRQTESGKQPLTPYVAGGAGLAWQLAPRLLLTSLGTADLEVSKKLPQNFDVAPGLDIGLVGQWTHFSMTMGGRSKFWLNDNLHREDTLYANASWHLNRQFSIFSEFQRQDQFNRTQHTWQIGLRSFF